jgi:hypothetical protein
VSIKELRNKKPQPNQPETKSTEKNTNVINPSADLDKDSKQKLNEDNTSNKPQQSNAKEQLAKVANKDEKNQSSQSQLNNQPKQSLDQQQQQQQMVSTTPPVVSLSVDEIEPDKANISNDLILNANNSSNLLSNKNDSVNNLQQQTLQPKFQINEETALKLSQLGLNEFAIKNLQNAPLNEQLIIANALQNWTLNQTNKTIDMQQNVNQLSVKNTGETWSW